MRTIPLLIGLLLSLGTLPAHANALPLETQVLQPNPDEIARLVISRDRDAPNACNVEVRLGEQVLVPVPLGESVTLELPPGEHSLLLSIEPGGYCADIPLSNSQSILIEPASTRYFQLVYKEDALFLAPQD
ncbi:MAG: hypothetical protein ACN6O6_07985 [Pseudomonas sp.]|uniref:hypothetical protein n=1 Tax=Pseudomonas sp. TaxID=306 RepID=UPI003D0AC9DB